MRVRQTANPEVLGYASRYNVHSLNEMIVYFDDGDCDSDYVGAYEFQLRNGEWAPHRDPRIVADDYNTCFGEAPE